MAVCIAGLCGGCNRAGKKIHSEKMMSQIIFMLTTGVICRRYAPPPQEDMYIKCIPCDHQKARRHAIIPQQSKSSEPTPPHQTKPTPSTFPQNQFHTRFLS